MFTPVAALGEKEERKKEHLQDGCLFICRRRGRASCKHLTTSPFLQNTELLFQSEMKSPADRRLSSSFPSFSWKEGKRLFIVLVGLVQQ